MCVGGSYVILARLHKNIHYIQYIFYDLKCNGAKFISCCQCKKSRHLSNCSKMQNLEQPKFLKIRPLPKTVADCFVWTCDYCKVFDPIFEEEPRNKEETNFFAFLLLVDNFSEWVSYTITPDVPFLVIFFV